MSLFPLKVRRLFENLSQEGILDKLAEDAKRMPVNSPEDGQTRIVLCTPGVRYAAQQDVELDVRKIRLAIPQDLNWLYLADGVTLEFYDEDDNPLTVPQPLTGVGPHLACAIEAELFHAIVRAKGICIPMDE